jgi:hypothetical protein
MSHRPATSRLCAIWSRSLGTVAALLHRGISSPHTIACPLHTSGRSAPFYHRPAAPMSCTHLMPVIHCIWHVTYAFNAPSALRAWRGPDGPDVRCLGNKRVRPGAKSHWARGSSGALPHQEAGLEPHEALGL